MIGRSTRTYCWTTIPCVRHPVRGVIIVHKAFTVACASQSVLENVDEAAFVMGKMEGTHQRTTPHALPKVPDAEPRVRVCSSSTSKCSRSPQLVQRAGPGAPDHPRGVIFVEDAAIACSRLDQSAAASPSGRPTRCPHTPPTRRNKRLLGLSM